jgi:hypothetical protein
VHLVIITSCHDGGLGLRLQAKRGKASMPSGPDRGSLATQLGPGTALQPP